MRGVVLLIAAVPLYAQARVGPPNGVHQYEVQGLYEGTPMAP